MKDNSKGIALVTGCSSGIGLTYAEKLAEQGYDLILVARSENKLDVLAHRLRESTGRNVEVFATDLSDQQQLNNLADKIKATDNLTLLVNNAGLGDIKVFAQAQWQDLNKMLMVNVVALTQLTHAALPNMIAQGGGTIINISSGFAFGVMDMGVSVYGASKSYVAHFTEILHEEVKDKNITLQALIPGLTRTNLGGAEESGFFDKFPPELVMSTDDLVDASFAGLKLGELICIPRLDNYNDWLEASEKMRAVGQSPNHNQAAGRYK